MKKTICLLTLIALIVSFPVNGQGLLKKVTNSMKDELLGTGKSGNSATKQPEPSSACDQAEMVLDLGGKLKLDYTEISINTRDDGSLLIQDRISGNFYIVKGGVTTGPIPAGDQRLAGFDNGDDGDNSQDAIYLRNRKYISKSGEKYTINFAGTNYGPYSQISQFTVTKSGDKFAAVIVENIVMNESEGKKMEDAINKAKTDQERMDLAMQYTQQIQQNMMAGGGPNSILPKVITNIPGATFDPLQGGTIQGNWKYDDILVSAYDKVLDMEGKNVINLKPEFLGAPKLFVNSTNSKYASYSYGTLTFSDDTSIPELMNPQLIKVEGKIFLAYMYYSPKRNAIMQCKIAY
jgi:hypothetical protein